ncbi:unnamed protein product [Cuscuta campestris]|uniref:Retrovirus-related Pol polyprotein from transposon TNT 1-94-like beta-barrel domain-containing protein n=1 Tax=Cuscuta campestris TaxID=132261 RepID=A0A484M8H9_9ASTE|nr:unnamed protein product [Cuscuta campestris]
MLVSWIFNTIDGSLRNSITQVEEAAQLWKDIQERFSVADGPRVNQLKKELANCKQNGQPIASYFGKIKNIWDELGRIEKLPTCAKCRACKCGAIKTIETQKENEKVHQFLMGLDNEGYSGVRSNILSTTPLAPLNRVYPTIIQQEGVLKVTTQEEEKNPVSFAVIDRANRERADRDTTRDVKCKHCGMNGNEISGCFQLIGYLEWWGDRPRGQNNNRGGSRVGRGGGRLGGRTGASGGRNSRTPAGFGTTAAAHTARTEKASSEREAFTSEQWSTLMNLLKEKDIPLENTFSGNLTTSWIIDIGASQHMTGNEEVLTHVERVQHCSVTLPNGDIVAATKKGRVQLSGTLTLANVLLVPNLNCNLIFVSQLLCDKRLIVQFIDKVCLIQDFSSKTVIGAGRRLGGIYFLQKGVPDKACVVRRDDVAST